MTTITAYKGFNRDLTCKGFQYEIGKTYHTDKADICKCGFHACTEPLECLYYYPPNKSRYCEVELFGEISADRDNDIKICATDIRIVRELTLFEITELATKLRIQRAHEIETTSGKYGAATASGEYGAATTSGYRSAATASGNRSAATTSGNFSAATTSGNFSVATTSGDCSAATAKNRTAIAVAWGQNGRVSGVVGSHLVSCEWNNGEMISAKMVQVDGEIIKENTLYTLRDGEFVEVNQLTD